MQESHHSRACRLPVLSGLHESLPIISTYLKRYYNRQLSTTVPYCGLLGEQRVHRTTPSLSIESCSQHVVNAVDLEFAVIDTCLLRFRLIFFVSCYFERNCYGQIRATGRHCNIVVKQAEQGHRPTLPLHGCFTVIVRSNLICYSFR
jgi:hypothetical protein